jgi:NAD(P)H-hydrate epimerase
MQVLTVAQMREIERAADAAGLSYSQMMQNAGRNAASVILQRLSEWRARWISAAERPVRVLVLVGPGNNGGDGLVCACALHNAAAADPALNLEVQVYLLKPRAEDDPVFAPVRQRNLFCANAQDDLRLRVLHQMVTHADVIVDALLGTGVSRPIDGPLREVLDEVRATRGVRSALLVALDGVTGMNYDTGALDEAAVPADLSITFHAPKRGHYAYPAAKATGELVVVPIGADDMPGLPTGNVQCADDVGVAATLPTRAPDANKGSYGRVLVIGGCSDYAGAPTLAAEAAYRVGAGLVTLVVPHAIQLSAATWCREATFLTLHESEDHLRPEVLPRLAPVINKLDARHGLVIGPGMGQAPQTKDFLLGLCDFLKQQPNSAHPDGIHAVFDADALNHLSTLPDWPTRLPTRSVLTPHPGEMARLTGMSVKDVQADRFACALEYSKRWGHIVVLKGAYSVVACPENYGIVLPCANSALAVAGTGDVLTGCIAGMLAQGLSAFDAALCGAYLHAKAGELWRQQHGDAGLLAGDLLPRLPDVLTTLRRAYAPLR